MDAATHPGRQHGVAPSGNHRIDYGAVIFMATVVLSLLCIATLARNIFSAAHHLELAKRNGELVARTLADVGATRKQGKSDLAACQPSADSSVKATWGPCWNEILQGPDMSRLVNMLEPGNPVFGQTCDGSDEAIGRIIIERGTTWFSAGNTGVTFAPSDGDDSIVAEAPLRIQVCNRWGEPVKVQEIKF